MASARPPHSPKGTRPSSAQTEDKQNLHPGRILCYYWKKEHREKLEKIVDEGLIRYDTHLTIHVEYCTAMRPSMSLRPSFQGCQTIKTALEKAKNSEQGFDRYKHNFEMLSNEVEDALAVDKNSREGMWKVKVESNATDMLGPRNLSPEFRRPRLGSFEIVMKFEGTDGGKKEVVLFSKLNTLRFPNPPDVVTFLLSALAPARQTGFKVVVRHAETGESVRGALVRAEDLNGVRFPPDRPLTRGGDTSMSVGGGDRVYFQGRELTYSEVARTGGDKYGGVELKLPFGAFNAYAQGTLPPQGGGGGGGQQAHPRQPTTAEEAEGVPAGQTSFYVHGDLPKSVCIPVVPPVAEGDIWVVLTWGEFPHTVHLYVRTPEGVISPVNRETPNGKLATTHKEGGYGPITVLLRDKLLDGRYHLFARCENYTLGNKLIGWAESNAQVTVYGADNYSWEGPRFFCRPKEGAGPWWDVCFFEVSKGGNVVKVTEFGTLQSEEPGFRPVTIRVCDLAGRPVIGALVRATPTNVAYREHAEAGESDRTGTLERNLAMGHYTLTTEHPDFLPSVMTVNVDLQAYCNFCTVPLVRVTDFHGPEEESPGDRLLVLAWGGPGLAELHAETPGRLARRLEPGDPGRDHPARMCVAAGCPTSLLLAPPVQQPEFGEDETVIDPPAVKDRFYISYVDKGTPMECCNMHLLVYSRKGILYTANPPAGGAAKARASGPEYWEAGFVEHDGGGEVPPVFKEIAKRSWVEPKKGHVISLRLISAKEPSEGGGVPAQVTIKKKQTGEIIRTFQEPPLPGTIDYSDGEYASFLEYGEYMATVSDDQCLGERPGGGAGRAGPDEPVSVHVRCHAAVQRSLGVCMVHKSEIDAKTALLTLTWADAPMDLDLCVRGQDGLLSGAATASTPAAGGGGQGGGGGAKGGAPANKGLKYESMSTGGGRPGAKGGFGPKVISFTQPMSGKFKVYVMARETPGGGERVPFVKCCATVCFATFEGIRSFRLRLPDDAVEAELARSDPGPPCWHVFDLRVETDSKWSDCFEITEVNKLLPSEVSEN